MYVVSYHATVYNLTEYHTWKILEWEKIGVGKIWQIECLLPIITLQILPFIISCSYTCSSFTNILPTNWFGLARLHANTL